MRLATPPESHTQQAAAAVDNSNKSSLLMMGFPSRVTDPNPSLCACHSRPTTGGYLCSRCSSKVCSLPTTCPACSLTLILSTHLARSYHHLFPLQNWKTVSWSRATSVSQKHKTLCFSCQSPFAPNLTTSTKLTSNNPNDTTVNGIANQISAARISTKAASSDAQNADSTSAEPSAAALLKSAQGTGSSHKQRDGDQTVSESGRYECGTCGQFFCVDCDVFCHEIVHNCPGCLSREGEMILKSEGGGQNGEEAMEIDQSTTNREKG